MRVGAHTDDAWFHGGLGLARITLTCGAFLFGLGVSYRGDLVVGLMSLSTR